MSILFHGARKLDALGHVDDFWMLVDGTQIVSTGSGLVPESDTRAASSTIDVGGRWLVPGFIDLHGHGGGGHSFDDSAEEIAAGLAVHRAHGTTRSVVSLVASPMARLMTSLSAIADVAATDRLVLGSHLEGPFLAPGNRGAHDLANLLEPEPHELELLIGAARGTLRQLTLAPELPGSLEAIDVLVEAGVAVAIGHTMADEAQAHEAFDRGARILTHAFNAMPGIHHRAPGPVIAAIDDDRVTLELILDGRHVLPSVARMAFTAAPGRVALITDAMAAAGSSDGNYQLGGLNVTVHDGIALLSGTSTLAGSTLTQDASLRCAITAVGLTPRDAVTALTLTPARALGLDHRHGLLAAGYAADAVLLDHDWRVSAVWANGAKL